MNISLVVLTGAFWGGEFRGVPQGGVLGLLFRNVSFNDHLNPILEASVCDNNYTLILCLKRKKMPLYEANH